MTLESATIFAKMLGIRTEYLMCEDDYPTALDVFHDRINTDRGKESLIDELIKLLSYKVEYSKSASTYKAVHDEYDLISASNKDIPFIFHPDNPDTYNDLVILTDYNLKSHTTSLETYMSLKKEIIEFVEFKLQRLMKEGEIIETS
jgi:hypothetical protein